MRRTKYQKANEYFKPYHKQQEIFEPYTEIPRKSHPIKPSKISKKIHPTIPPNTLHKTHPSINVKNITKIYPNTSDPSFWGPSFWLSLHNGSLRYPENPSDIYKERMKGFIKGIPFMVPCKECFIHATAFIENSDLELITSNRTSLFNFFVDFHNVVNKRYNKPQISYKEARRIYSGKAKVTYIKY